MIEKLMSFFKEKQETEQEKLLKYIVKAKEDISNAYRNFDMASDDKTIDLMIFELNSAYKKYEILLSLAKEKGISSNMPINENHFIEGDLT